MIATWDIVSGSELQTISSQLLKGFRYFPTLIMDLGGSLSIKGARLLKTGIETGTIRIPYDSNHLLCAHKKEEAMQALRVEADWIFWGSQRPLWLPPSYRAQCLDWHDGKLVLGRSNGQVAILVFDVERLKSL